jgi:hypothetical protein
MQIKNRKSFNKRFMTECEAEKELEKNKIDKRIDKVKVIE